MEKTLMTKDNMVHYVPYDSVKDFINCGWKKADLTETEIIKKADKEPTKRKSKKSN